MASINETSFETSSNAPKKSSKAPSKEFFDELNTMIPLWKDEPEVIYRVEIHPARGEVFEASGITSVLFKAKGAPDLWLKMYQYIAKRDQKIADTKFYNNKIFKRFLDDNDIGSAVEMYTGCVIEIQGDDIWAVEMKWA